MSDLFWLRDQPPAFLAEAGRKTIEAIQKLIPDAEVYEVGSTAVPGAIGKQDIDVLVSVPSHLFQSAQAILDAAYARDLQQFSSADYQGYCVSVDPDIKVQFTVMGSRYDRFLPFLEALRSDPKLLKRYNRLKLRWNGRPMIEYRKAKARFIEAVLSSSVKERGDGVNS